MGESLTAARNMAQTAHSAVGWFTRRYRPRVIPSCAGDSLLSTLAEPENQRRSQLGGMATDDQTLDVKSREGTLDVIALGIFLVAALTFVCLLLLR